MIGLLVGVAGEALTKIVGWLGDGGRKLVGLVCALVGLGVLPPEAYQTVAILYGAFVGGNAVERWSKRQGPMQPSPGHLPGVEGEVDAPAPTA